MQITPELIRAALAHIPANLPRDEWARVCMAIKSEYPDATGRALFEDWSATADTYHASDCASTWRSVRAGGGVAIGTLLHLAKQNGFELPKADQPAEPPSAAELARRDAERKAAAQSERERVEREHAAAAAEAQSFWDGNCQDVTEPTQAPYLVRKGIAAHGVRHAPPGVLCVPLCDGEGALWNVQRIAATKPERGPEKTFFKGGRKSGLWHMLGSPAGAAVIVVAEGYATAASVFEATGYPSACAFDCGNLIHVAKALHRLHPAALLAIAADDDRHTEARTGTNPGRTKAEAAARAVRGLAVLPEGMPANGEPLNWDYNDQHRAHGLAAVRATIAAAIDAYRQAAAAAPPASPPTSPPAPAGAGGDDAGDGPDAFTVDDGGVYFHGYGRDGKALAPLWLCSRLDVIARTRDQDAQSWGYLLAFADPLQRPKQWAMPARMLSGDGAEYRAMLLGMGLRIATSPAARNKLTEYLQTRRPSEFATCTDRIGWHPTEAGGAAYVLPHATIGAGDQRIVFQSDSAMENTWRMRKDAAAWRDRIGLLCRGNSRLMFAVSCAFAGPLLRPAGIESGGMHLRGDSSSGKTTALRLAASVNGGPSYMQRWRATDNALEAIAAQHCDALLILDELAQVDGKVAGECAYMLANEQSKARATRGGAPRARLSWRLLFLSAGELGLADHMAEGQRRTRTGQEIRMVDIPADAGKCLGAFEEIHGHASPSAFAQHLTREAAQCHGAPGVAFIEWAAAHWPELPRRLREGVAAIAAKWVPEGASGQVQRVANRFALVAMAGELATEAGLTGWDYLDATWAAEQCFDAWLQARGGAGNGEVRAMLRQVRRFMETNGEGRFTWWHRAADDHNAKTLSRAGFRRMLNEQGEPIKTNAAHMGEFGDHISAAQGEAVSVEYFILPEVFRSEVCQGFDPEAVCRTLVAHECLKTEAGRFTIKTRLPGMGPSRCYHITPAIFGLDV
ncbi:DUF927 domain-containing protein [Comamonas badia]|uniref:DUF927 domain-containing protein n=1 Tax=Comamonas badia TaxID=265291 RepID=UPI000428DB4A|nr:DUF927 domain-containing protein [Comamonas badia]